MEDYGARKVIFSSYLVLFKTIKILEEFLDSFMK